MINNAIKSEQQLQTPNNGLLSVKSLDENKGNDNEMTDDNLDEDKNNDNDE